MRLLTIFGFFLCLSGCSTIPDTSNYLLTNSASEVNDQRIAIERIEISDYIDHRDIVLELEDGSYHRANYHKWGETIEDGIVRILEGLPTAEPSISIQLSVDRFHGTESGEIELSGQWKETNDDFWQAFKLVSNVTKSGYPAMVEEQARLVEKLRQKILSN